MRGIRIVKWTFLILGLALSPVALVFMWGGYRGISFVPELETDA